MMIKLDYDKKVVEESYVLVVKTNEKQNQWH